MGKLRAAFIKKYPDYDVSSIYQGYLDMSYFSLSTKPLKDKGLKIAIVYLHEKGTFEVWLSARNRDIARTHQSILDRLRAIGQSASTIHLARHCIGLAFYGALAVENEANPVKINWNC